ncbi:nucleoside triphosphate pyrophosphatase, partial [Paenibacillus sp. EPM92]
MSITTTKIVILASSSPRRQQLISSLSLPYRIEVSDVDETTDPGRTPSQIVEELSERKARAIYERYEREPAQAEDGVIVGSDTIVVLDGNVLGKPRDEEDAFRMLKRLQGREHEVYSGVACIGLADGRTSVAHERTVVRMKPMSDERIRRYIATREPLDKAGDYDTTMHLGDIGQYRIISESPDGRPEIIVGHTVSKVTFRPMSDEEIWAYVKTGDPLDKAGAYGVQGIGSVFIEKIEG